jgi:hypothetical protein
MPAAAWPATTASHPLAPARSRLSIPGCSRLAPRSSEPRRLARLQAGQAGSLLLEAFEWCESAREAWGGQPRARQFVNMSTS